MSPILALLNEMRPRRLAMYLGSVSILKLADFLRGYEHAVWRLGHQNGRFLADFRDWIHERYQTTKISWEELILLDSKDEADAVDHFWRLLDEFLTEYPEHNDEPKRSDALAHAANGAIENAQGAAIPVGLKEA